LDHPAIGGDDVAGSQDHDITDDDVFGRHGDFGAVTPHLHLDLDLGEESVDGDAGAVLLPEAQHPAGHDDGEDDDPIGQGARRRRRGPSDP
jgi:hypothetical protein